MSKRVQTGSSKSMRASTDVQPKSASTMGSSTQLLRRLSSSPALPGLVQSLQPHALRALIEAVGVGDASELMQLATPAQLCAALDVAVWSSPTRGAAEVFAADRFVDWLETWLGVSDSFAAERLCALGADYLAQAFSVLVKVRDTHSVAHAGARRWDNAPAPDRDEPSDADAFADADAGRDGDPDDDEALQEYEADDALYSAMALQFAEFEVVTVAADEWDVVSAALHALWAEAPDALITMLRRLSPVHSHWRHADELRAQLQTDVTAARKQFQEGAGFVTSVGAQAFLSGVAELGLAGNEAATRYDGETASYFLRLNAAGAAQAADAQRDAAERALGDADALDAMRPGAPEDVGASSSAPPNSAQHASELEQLHVLLANAGIGGLRSSPAAAGLLTGPSANDGRPPLRIALEALQLAQPHAVADRLRELSYLANILMKSQRRDGVPFVASDASEAAIATASLGLDWLQLRDPAGAAASLRAEPGAVRLFAIGWCLIAGLPARVVNACELALAGTAAVAKLAKRNWMREEVVGALDDLGRHVRARDFLAARGALTLLSLVFDPAVCRALRSVLDEVPRIDVHPATSRTRRVDASGPDAEGAGANDAPARWICSLDDVRQLTTLLQKL